ncbi:hypothetical protein [Saccharothrix xinjiangensis]|uniref:Uncharacterized protein n=1 Tax=Saccharothrix xinjiangensis TaxID=204798 RepID=A0ABV9Y8W0_9PSEU
MGEFFTIAFAFPTAVLSVLLVVVVVYWSLIAFGAAEADWVELDIGGVPATVGLSLLIAFSWFACLVGAVLLEPATGPGVRGAGRCAGRGLGGGAPADTAGQAAVPDRTAAPLWDGRTPTHPQGEH